MSADHLALLYVVSPPERLPTRWSFARSASHRRKFRDQALAGLSREITQRGGDLLIAEGRAVDVVSCLTKEIGAEALFCEAIAAPDEIAELESIHESGLSVYDVWRSSRSAFRIEAASGCIYIVAASRRKRRRRTAPRVA